MKGTAADWHEFIEQYWESLPCIISINEQPVTVSETNVYKGIQNGIERFIQGEDVPIRLFIEDRSVRANLALILSEYSSPNTSEYLNSLQSKLEDNSFTLLINEFHKFDNEVYSFLRNFLSPLFEEIGYPQDILVALFAGKYSRTSFGVHKDNDHTFYRMVKGGKNVYLWPPDYSTDWLHNESGGNLNYDKDKLNASIYKLSEGETLYIPKDWWHVMESEKELGTLALSVGVPLAGSSLFMEVIKEFFIDELKLTDQKMLNSNDVVIDIKEKLMTKNTESLYELYLEKRTKRLSSLGFRVVPENRTCKEFNDETEFRLVKNCMRYKNSVDKIICYVQGYKFSLPTHDEFVQLLNLIQSGGVWSAKNINSSLNLSSNSTLTTKGILSFLRKLYELNAIDTINEQHRSIKTY